MTPDGPRGARKKVLIPTFLLHPDADALLQTADDIETIIVLSSDRQNALVKLVF